MVQKCYTIKKSSYTLKITIMSNLFQRAFKDERFIPSLIGLSSKEFYDLAKPFFDALEKNRNSPKRKRAPGGGRKLNEESFGEVVFYSERFQNLS